MTESKPTLSAKEELEKLLAEMTPEDHQALEKLCLQNIPMPAPVFSKLIETIPIATQKRYYELIKKLRRLNAILDLTKDLPRLKQKGSTNSQGSDKSDSEQKLKEIYIQKYTNGHLLEAVLVGGLPYFVQVNSDNDEVVLIKSKLQIRF